MRLLRNIKHWLVKVYQYAVLLWPDRDWDWAFILVLLQFKLARVRKCILKNQLIEEAEKVADQIRYAELLIDRILADEYLFKMSEYQEYEKKWGDYDLSDGHLARANAKTEEQKEECSRELRPIIDKATKLEQQDWNALWSHLRKHLRGWWD